MYNLLMFEALACNRIHELRGAAQQARLVAFTAQGIASTPSRSDRGGIRRFLRGLASSVQGYRALRAAYQGERHAA